MDLNETVVIIEDGFGLFEDPETKKKCIVKRFTLKNATDMTVQLINYGATITSILVPDKDGKVNDVILGFDELDRYLANKSQRIGSIVGRVANRISQGRFKIYGEEFQLTKNENKHHLHGGDKGFDQRVWQSHVENGRKVVFSYLSKDGEEGYPGNLLVQVTYSIVKENGLQIEMRAMSTKPTPVNLSSHGYFNLAGHETGSRGLFEHKLNVNADRFLTKTAENLPTGEISLVSGDLDLRRPKLIMNGILQMPGGGYDHTMLLEEKGGPIKSAALVIHPRTGRTMEVLTDQLALQLYTGCGLPATHEEDDKKYVLKGKKGAVYEQYGALCLETQNYTDAVNHSNFPDTVCSLHLILLSTSLFAEEAKEDLKKEKRGLNGFGGHDFGGESSFGHSFGGGQPLGGGGHSFGSSQNFGASGHSFGSGLSLAAGGHSFGGGQSLGGGGHSFGGGQSFGGSGHSFGGGGHSLESGQSVGSGVHSFGSSQSFGGGGFGSGQHLGGGRISVGHGTDEESNVAATIITRKIPITVPKPYIVEVEKKVPYTVKYAVEVPIHKPYEVPVPRPYHVTVEKKVPVTVEKPVPYSVKVPVKVDAPQAVHVSEPKPHVVEVPKAVHVPVPKTVFVPKAVPVYSSDDSGSSGRDVGHEGGLGRLQLRRTSLEDDAAYLVNSNPFGEAGCILTGHTLHTIEVNA
uniref:Galactose mutarotase n=1 Tax=Timema genevievae TaxID=629358 RepID=A0A7R9JTX3_TIMGE|nr:unnamed protein product [Timema genevievae]